MIKGALDILLPRCDTLLDDKSEVVTLTDVQLQRIDPIKDSWARQRKRVILLARKPTVKPFSSNYEKEILVAARQGPTFVGVLGIVDPPRDEIPEVVCILHGASIRMFMVTGDFELTAQAIPKECGIVFNSAMMDDVSALSRDGKIGTTKQAIVLSGSALITRNDDQWDQLCQYQETLFVRTTFEQKLRIVKEFQRRENIVGMTGDGVKDVPSLKAADVVLLDLFAAVVEVVQSGLLVYDNLKKTVSIPRSLVKNSGGKQMTGLQIVYLLPTGSFSRLWPVVTNFAFGVPQILSLFLLVIICCLTDCAAVITLAYEKPGADVLLRPPRNPRKDRLVDTK